MRKRNKATPGPKRTPEEQRRQVGQELVMGGRHWAKLGWKPAAVIAAMRDAADQLEKEYGDG